MKINKRYELAKKKLPIYWNKLVHNENINVVWSKDGKDYLLFVNAKDGDEIIYSIISAGNYSTNII